MKRFYSIFILITVVLFLVSGCAQQKPKKVKTAVVTSNNLVPMLPTNISFSNGFVLFWNDFMAETQGLSTLNNYTPSEALKASHNIIIMPNNIYGIQGFLQVKVDEFDALKFEKLGGFLTYFSDGIYTFSMPLNSLPEMLKVEGIVQIELAQKVRMR